MAAYTGLALANYNTGEPEAVIALVDKALRLSPLDAQRPSWFVIAGLANITLHRDDQAVDLLRRAVTINPKITTGRAFLAGALGLTGHDAEAREMVQQYMAIPEARIKSTAALKKQKNSDNPRYLATRERICEGLRKAVISATCQPKAPANSPPSLSTNVRRRFGRLRQADRVQPPFHRDRPLSPHCSRSCGSSVQGAKGAGHAPPTARDDTSVPIGVGRRH